MDKRDRHCAIVYCLAERARMAKVKTEQAARKGGKSPERQAQLDAAAITAADECAAIEDAADAFSDALDELAALRASGAPVTQQPEADNPFKAHTYLSDNGPVQTYHCAADDRLRALASFDQAQCEAALRVPGLQAVVRNALERRLRRLTRDAAGG